MVAEVKVFSLYTMKTARNPDVTRASPKITTTNGTCDQR